ncbi:MAG: hypothetical protein A3H95_16805 [Acidobacteria bacterium RIFCSPLOWO2_02_FULL_64_15]|nr:MAG: hypothetical protein A3H95_16805 [Acidobacteria bacterium RIFCSPLOWO2_02_FULL_64_15]
MSPKTASTYRIDDELLDALREVKERDGIPQSEQIRRAILMWVESKGVKVKAASRRARKRRKA